MRDQGGQVISQLGKLPTRGTEHFTNIRKDSNSPSRKELNHMRPSNFFEDITEEQFNLKETEKHRYKLEL